MVLAREALSKNLVLSQKTIVVIKLCLIKLACTNKCSWHHDVLSAAVRAELVENLKVAGMGVLILPCSDLKKWRWAILYFKVIQYSSGRV